MTELPAYVAWVYRACVTVAIFGSACQTTDSSTLSLQAIAPPLLSYLLLSHAVNKVRRTAGYGEFDPRSIDKLRPLSFLCLRRLTIEYDYDE
ncbi:hypothetical protein K449DRAFT_380770 [Hypoxylon sp. EC38]|nr:hypothetical protein K449DRAFT_380770 [Hypoxylon sp. EC38]